MDSITPNDNIRPATTQDASEVPANRTWTLAAAKSDVERGLISSFAINVHDDDGAVVYTLFIQSALAKDGGGPLVDARTGRIRKFKTLDAAHSAIRQAGARCNHFQGSAT